MHPKFKPNPPASEKALQELTNSLPKPLPPAYFKIMAIANGGTGFVGPRHLELWPVEQLLQKNKQHHARDMFLIGSDGKDEAFAFNLTKPDSAIYKVSLASPDAKHAQLVAHSFDAFLPRINLFRQNFSSGHK